MEKDAGPDVLVGLSQAADCTIELVRQMGGFVASGDPLFRFYRGETTISSNALYQSVPALHQELSLLHKTADRSFLEPEDRALAEVSDFQGVGGSLGQSSRETR